MIFELLAVAAALFGGSGAIRLSRARDRADAAMSQYQSIQEELAGVSTERDKLITAIASVASRGVKEVVMAQRILSPLRAKWAKPRLTLPEEDQSHGLALHQASALSTEFYAAASVAVGVASAGALWTGIQILGIASTGMPTVFLSGAALHHAALACLGGGSLATGGAGMLGGSMVLASAVILPAGCFFGFKTHSEASRLNDLASEIEGANRANLTHLSSARVLNKRLDGLGTHLCAKTDDFTYTVHEVRRKLFRFGFLSHMWRLFRARFWDSYYSDTEMEFVDELSAATVAYTAVFENFKNDLAT